jgi:transcriptional regulator with XRE-family HTH domain
MARKRILFADQLRSAIEHCGKSRYQISKETGIGQEVLSRFMAGKKGLSMDSIERLFENLGLTVSKR